MPRYEVIKDEWLGAHANISCTLLLSSPPSALKQTPEQVKEKALKNYAQSYTASELLSWKKGNLAYNHHF